MLDDDQKRADAELHEKIASNFTKALEGSGVSPIAIAEKCGVTEQAVSNWKRTGKIRTRHLLVVSEMTGWSLRRLLTGEPDQPAPTRQAGPPAPGDFHDRLEVTPSDWALLQEVKDIQHAPRLNDRLEELRRDMDSLREFAKQYNLAGGAR